VAIDAFTSNDFERAIDRIDSLDLKPADIRSRALGHFDVLGGINQYDAVYRQLHQDALPDQLEPSASSVSASG
jgi:hypothetical protein